MSIKKPISRSFTNGLTVRELKELIKDWPDVDPVTGEECEVWIGNEKEKGTSNQCTSVFPLNLRNNGSKFSADVLLEHSCE